MNKERKKQLLKIIKASNLCRYATRYFMDRLTMAKWRKEVRRMEKELIDDLEKVCDYIETYGR